MLGGGVGGYLWERRLGWHPQHNTEGSVCQAEGLGLDPESQCSPTFCPSGFMDNAVRPGRTQGLPTGWPWRPSEGDEQGRVLGGWWQVDCRR